MGRLRFGVAFAVIDRKWNGPHPFGKLRAGSSPLPEGEGTKRKGQKEASPEGGGNGRGETWRLQR